jgi:hypothetical protein
MLPPQLAIVLSLSTSDQELAVRRRRNRSYIGPITTGKLETDGTVGTALRTAIVDDVETLDTGLRNVPLETGVSTDYEGLCIVSYAGIAGIAQIAAADQIRVGSIVDTQRSRRNGLNESYTAATLPAA